jgi:hypothetical protein
LVVLVKVTSRLLELNPPQTQALVALERIGCHHLSEQPQLAHLE